MGTAQELAWDGMDAYEEGDYKEAIEKFQNIKGREIREQLSVDRSQKKSEFGQ